MSSSFNSVADTEYPDEIQINIPLMQLKRANQAAIDYLGSSWSPSHDKFAARWLFKRGIINDFQKEQLYAKIAEKVARIKKMNPNQGGWRIW